MTIGDNKVGGVQAVGLRFERGRLVVELNDQREISVPLERYPTLATGQTCAAE